MQKPSNYDATKAAGEFEPVELGGHKLIIKGVKERPTSTGKDMLVIAFDFAPDDKQPGYFQKQFNDDIRPEKKWPNGGTNYMVVDQNTKYGVRSLKTFITSIEKSNYGFTTWWASDNSAESNAKFCAQFKGKLIGGVFRQENGYYNGNNTHQHKLAWFCSVDAANDAKVPDPVDTQEYTNYMNEQKRINDNGGFMSIPDGVDEALPFN